MKTINEKLSGIVQRITFHSEDTGWSVLRVTPFNDPSNLATVTVHQTKVFAGATMEFHGAWTFHQKFGRQFKAVDAVEKKPASAAALEKYLGSGLIKGVGPKTAKRIVQHFKDNTLNVFEHDIAKLTEVEGIATKKLEMIKDAWQEHRMIREVMMFLQGHGISTLFAVRIYKKYGDDAIQTVTDNPYRLANDFYGIGFYSADQIALSIGLPPDSSIRIIAAIKHILAAGREQGHCYLTRDQIAEHITELLSLDISNRLEQMLIQMEEESHLKVRHLPYSQNQTIPCYYSRTLFYDEEYVAKKIFALHHSPQQGLPNAEKWLDEYCNKNSFNLSQEQADSVLTVVSSNFSILTGGPGCGKTTTTLAIVRLLESYRKKVLLAAPTGRAAQRMGEVIGREAKTIHRLLEFQMNGFARNEEQPLSGDFLIVDECSMLDISLTASLLKAVNLDCQVLFIGDADQLPSVGAGNVLHDILASNVITTARLNKIFRQAQESHIIKYAHAINKGETPRIESPFKSPHIWTQNIDCIFMDSDEATKEQINFVAKAKRAFSLQTQDLENLSEEKDLYTFRTDEPIQSAYQPDFIVPDKFKHVDLNQIVKATNKVDELKAVLKKVHPWSSLQYGIDAVETVVRLYLDWIPKYQGKESEIQILSPMTRGTLGTANLNLVIQEAINPSQSGKAELKVGERIFRVGDRVIHKRNNYDLNVFNGDIGKIIDINNNDLTCVISFYPDNRIVEYQKDDIVELDLAYAITIHKSQGSEFKVVILPILTQHFKMLYRNLLYTGLTRAKSLAVFVGTRKALALAVRQEDSSKRQTALTNLLQQDYLV